MNVEKYLKDMDEACMPTSKCPLQILKDELGISHSYNEGLGLYTLQYSQIDSPKNDVITRECRSLVIDENYTVISRSFDRFFNYGENGYNPDVRDLVAHDKIDGSLINVFFYNGTWIYRTKSMIMPQDSMKPSPLYDISWKGLILEALGDEPYLGLDTEYTYIFELTSYANKVVTKYEDTSPTLTLLAARKVSGEYLSKDILDITASTHGWKRPETYRFSTYTECRDAIQGLPNLGEGVVLYNEYGVPVVKCKNPAYVAAHLLKGEGLHSHKRICDLIFMNEQDEYLSVFPEDRPLITPYEDAFKRLEDISNALYNKVKDIEDRKERASAIVGSKVEGIVFSMINNSIEFREAFDRISGAYKRRLVMGCMSMRVTQTDNDRYAISDCNVETWYKSVRNNAEVKVATEVQLARLRVAHKEGDIIIEHINTKEGVRIDINKYGKLKEWPEGFFDTMDNLTTCLAFGDIYVRPDS